MVPFVLPFSRSTNKTQQISEATAVEQALVNELKEGNEQAIAQLYQMYAGSLLNIIVRIVKYDEVAEDILQDTFMKIWKSIAQYDASKGRLFTWMANLAKNTAIDQVRSKYYTNAVKTDDISDCSIDILDQRNHTLYNPDVIGMKQLMRNLKPDQKHILDLIYFEGYTHVEVADRLNMPLGTVKTKIRLSILALRSYFNETNTTATLNIA